MIFNTLRPRQNDRHFPGDIFKCIFLSESVWVPIKMSLKFVPKGPINNIPGLVQIMAWRRPGDKSLFEPMVVSLTTHICVTRPQWVKRMSSEVSDNYIIKKVCRIQSRLHSLSTKFCWTHLRWINGKLNFCWFMTAFLLQMCLITTWHIGPMKG